MLKGSCLCGGVRYEVTGPFELMAYCHCVQCRKASGADFATNATVDAENFNLLAGEELLGKFESSPGNFRVFCSGCGSPVMKQIGDTPNKVRLRLGLLDDDLNQEPVVHVFVSQKQPWTKIQDSLAQLPEGPAKK
jgi:hypothetical protein